VPWNRDRVRGKRGRAATAQHLLSDRRLLLQPDREADQRNKLPCIQASGLGKDHIANLLTNIIFRVVTALLPLWIPPYAPPPVPTVQTRRRKNMTASISGSSNKEQGTNKKSGANAKKELQLVPGALLKRAS
jgi:hypothetical protein